MDDRHRPTPTELPDDTPEDCPFGSSPTVTDGTRRAVGQDPIDNDLRDRDVRCRERGQAVAALCERERLGEQDPVKGRPSEISEQVAGLGGVVGEQLDQPIGCLGPGDARELSPDCPMLTLQRVEHG
jgi:hypothetical protein